jgi:Lar family restriction alleviation protein
MTQKEGGNMQAADKLKSCPFCGFKHSLFFGGKTSAVTYGEQPHVVCMNCGVRGPITETFDRAIEQWNKRANKT